MTVDQKIYIKIAKKIKKQLKKKGQQNLFWLQYYEKNLLYLINVSDNKIQIEVVQGKSSVRVAPSDPLYSFLTILPGGFLRLGSAVQLKLFEGNEAGSKSAVTILDNENVTFWGAFIYGTQGGKDFAQLASLMLFGNLVENTSDYKFHFLNMKKRPRRMIGFMDVTEDVHEKRAEPISPPASKPKKATTIAVSSATHLDDDPFGIAKKATTIAVSSAADLDDDPFGISRSREKEQPKESVSSAEEVKSAEIDPFEIVEMDPFDDARVKKLEDEIDILRKEKLQNAELARSLEDNLKTSRLQQDQSRKELLVRDAALKKMGEHLSVKTSECECLLRSNNELEGEIEKRNQALSDIQFERAQEERDKEENARGLQKLMQNLKRDPKLKKENDEQKQKLEDLQLEVNSLKERSEKLVEKLELVTIESANYQGMFKQQISENDGITQRLDNVNGLYAGSQSRLKSLEVKIEAIKEDNKADKKLLIDKHRKQIDGINETRKKSLETIEADFQLEKELIVRRQAQLLEDVKVNEEEKSKIIENLTSDRNALQSTVDSIRKEMKKLSKLAKQEGLQKEVDFLKRELAEKREQNETLKHNITIQKKINPKKEKRKSKSLVPISLKKSSSVGDVQLHYRQIIANLTSRISDKEDTIRMLHESQKALASRLLETEGRLSEQKV